MIQRTPEAVEDIARARTCHRQRVAVSGSPQHRANARGELARIERFSEIVVGAEFEADDPVDILLEGGEEDDGEFRPAILEVAADIETRAVGEHDVEDDEIDAAVGEFLLAAPAVGRQRAAKALAFEIFAEKPADFGIVVDDENKRKSHLSLSLRMGRQARSDIDRPWASASVRRFCGSWECDLFGSRLPLRLLKRRHGEMKPQAGRESERQVFAQCFCDGFGNVPKQKEARSVTKRDIRPSCGNIDPLGLGASTTR